ncbi:hypothetical protein SAMN04488096_10176 [Mesonia phycicola]|uniref:Beta-lactamase-inhibitor-like, PepSY-like n=1 Tax=Mesonia phycicola TaxID=579105 RepID=A0A1M6A4X3_9FLAO|nr:hypothetical protein [Mesonia phycicola]SHI31500.1 hypothetical protein SAMN04488096_10176 [Mesonia phycicola]
MKNLSLITISLLILTSCNQDDDYSSTDVPSIVASTFQTNFSNAKDLEWEMIGENYEADFEIDNIDHSAIINEQGELIKYKYDSQFINLPQPLQDSLTTNYNQNQIDDVETLKIESDTYYQLEIDQPSIDLEKVYNEDGSENETIIYWD